MAPPRPEIAALYGQFGVTAYDDATSGSSPSVYATLTELTLDDARNIDSCARTVFGQSTVNKNYTVDSRNNYTGIGAASPSWTDNSELEDDDDGLTFTWNWRGELVSVDDGASTYTFEHDALGRRITTDFGTERRYSFAGERIVEEISAASSPTVLGTWAWGMDAEPVRMERSGTVSFYHADAEGSVEKLTSSAASVQESVEYGPWGEPSLSTSGQGNLFLWKGEVYDFDMELYDTREGTYDGAVMLRSLARAFGPGVVPGALPRRGLTPRPFCLTCPEEDGDRLPIDGGGGPTPPRWIDPYTLLCTCENGQTVACAYDYAIKERADPCGYCCAGESFDPTPGGGDDIVREEGRRDLHPCHLTPCDNGYCPPPCECDTNAQICFQTW